MPERLQVIEDFARQITQPLVIFMRTFLDQLASKIEDVGEP